MIQKSGTCRHRETAQFDFAKCNTGVAHLVRSMPLEVHLNRNRGWETNAIFNAARYNNKPDICLSPEANTPSLFRAHYHKYNFLVFEWISILNPLLPPRSLKRSTGVSLLSHHSYPYLSFRIAYRTFKQSRTTSESVNFFLLSPSRCFYRTLWLVKHLSRAVPPLRTNFGICQKKKKKEAILQVRQSLPSSQPHPDLPQHNIGFGHRKSPEDMFSPPSHILSTGLRPNNLIPFQSTCLAALYNAILAFPNSFSLPTTCK